VRRGHRHHTIQINDGKTLEIEFTLEDAKSWEGQWKMTKRRGAVAVAAARKRPCAGMRCMHLRTIGSDKVQR